MNCEDHKPCSYMSPQLVSSRVKAGFFQKSCLCPTIGLLGVHVNLPKVTLTIDNHTKEELVCLAQLPRMLCNMTLPSIFATLKKDITRSIHMKQKL